jgi:hypothetical protein
MPRRRRNRPRRGPRGTSVRVTTTRNGKTTSYRTGGISITGVSPTGRVAADPNLTIRAIVTDYGGGLTRNGIRFYLDGSQKSRFHYDPSSGRLGYFVGRSLRPGPHEVRIEADAGSSDRQGQTSSASTKRWTFMVVRR